MNDEKRLYRLMGGATKEPRVRLLAKVHAGILNGARTDGGKWMYDPAAEPGEVTEQAITDAETWSERFAEGQRADRIANTTRLAEKDATMKKAKKNVGLNEGRNEWRGLSMCQLIRFCGHKGLDRVTTEAKLNAVGLKPAKGTLVIQLGKGRKDRASVPDLLPDVQAELLGDKLPPATKTGDKPKVKLTAEERAAKKARKAARKAEKREKAHKLVGHDAPAAA